MEDQELQLLSNHTLKVEERSMTFPRLGPIKLRTSPSQRDPETWGSLKDCFGAEHFHEVKVI
jgi:hypothetical protein